MKMNVELRSRVTVHIPPTRTEAEQAAYEARLDAAIRAACPGWRLKQNGAAVRPEGSDGGR